MIYFINFNKVVRSPAAAMPEDSPRTTSRGATLAEPESQLSSVETTFDLEKGEPMRVDDMIPGRTSACTVVDVGVDWITLTSSTAHEPHDVTLANWYDVFNRVRHHSGMVEDASFLGYSGLKTEGMFIGTRFDGAMVRLSGPIARDNFLALQTAGASVTRLDLQVTCHWEGTGLHPPRLVALHATAANELLPTSRQRNVEERKDNRGGYTTYVGSRQSAAFLRCYHKSAQDPDAYGPNVYRYEVQYNKDSASFVLEALHNHQEVVEAAITALVWDWCERRGIIPVFRRSAERVIVSRETIPVTELDKKLQWLYTQVRPTVDMLMAQGHTAEALIALLGRDLGKDAMIAVETAQKSKEPPSLGDIDQRSAFRS